VSGTAKIRFEPSATDDITFTIAARGVFTEAKGTIKVGHYRADGNGGGFEAKVDCLVAGGPVATVTAAVTTSTSFPVGERIAVSVYDGGADRSESSRDQIGWSWSVPTGKVQPCMAPATFATVERGGFAVVGKGWPNRRHGGTAAEPTRRRQAAQVGERRCAGRYGTSHPGTRSRLRSRTQQAWRA
jgi:hypothetical protein